MESFFTFLICLLFFKKKKVKKRIPLYDLWKIVIKCFEEPNCEFLKQYESGNLFIVGSLGSKEKFQWSEFSDNSQEQLLLSLGQQMLVGESFALLTWTDLKHAFSWTALHLLF